MSKRKNKHKKVKPVAPSVNENVPHNEDTQINTNTLELIDPTAYTITHESLMNVLEIEMERFPEEYKDPIITLQEVSIRLKNRYISLLTQYHKLQQEVNLNNSLHKKDQQTQTDISETKISYKIDASSQTDEFTCVTDNLTETASNVNNQLPHTLQEENLQFDSNENSDNMYSKILIQNIPHYFHLSTIIHAITIISELHPKYIKFENKRRIRNSNKLNYVFSVPSNFAEDLIKMKTIKINSVTCNIQRYINIIRCFTCQKFGHFSVSCTNPVVCANCSQQHFFKTCKNPPKCSNCTFYNSKYKLNFNTDHPAFSSTCRSVVHYIHKITIPK